MAVYTEDFFEKLPDDVSKGLLEICNVFYALKKEITSTLSVIEDNVFIDYYIDYMEAYLGLLAYLKAKDLMKIVPDIFPDDGDKFLKMKSIDEMFKVARAYAENESEQKQIEDFKFKFETKMNLVFSYQFTDGDLTKIKNLIDDLRKTLISSVEISENHKERLLKRLDSLEKELGKKMSNLDKFYGLMGETAIIIKKYGPVVKTVADTVNSILKLVFMAHGKTFELPSDTNYPVLSEEVNTDF